MQGDFSGRQKLQIIIAVVTDTNCNNNDDDGSDSDDDKNDFKYQECIPLFIYSLWVASARVG